MVKICLVFTGAEAKITRKERTRMSKMYQTITMLRFKSAAVSGSLNPMRSAPVHI